MRAISIMCLSSIQDLVVIVILSCFFCCKAVAAGCIKKNETVGLLAIHQTNEDGQCIIFVQQNDPALVSKYQGTLKSVSDTSKRRYTFTQSGFLELYDADRAQEIQFTKITTELKYTVNKGEITIHLPSGQKMVLGESRGGGKGNLKSSEGFKSAHEDSSGLQLVPNNLDTLLASLPVIGAFPHEKKNSPFALISADGKIANLTSAEIFNKSEETYPTLRQVPLLSKINSKLKSEVKSNLVLINKTSTTTVPDKVDIPKALAPKVQGDALVNSTIDCKNFAILLDGMNNDYLKIQGELTLSRLAYFYLKDSNQPTENLKSKITRLLQESELKDKKELLSRKITVNSNLLRLKDRLFEIQKKWSLPDDSSFLLDETDFQYFSVLADAEKAIDDKKSIINFINMVDSSYRNSGNNSEEKFLALDKRFKILNQNKELALIRIKNLGTKCSVEARSSCTDCQYGNPSSQLNNIKDAVLNSQLKPTAIQWGAFWLHTGKKSK